DLPYQVNPDRLLDKMVEGVKDGKLEGISDIRDETSGREGQRIVVVLKKDAVPKVVLNNLYKNTPLQNNFSANMLALVDGVPRTLSLDGFVRHWVSHQMDVIRRRTEYRLNEILKRLHILEGYLKALDMLDEVISTIRNSPTVDEARSALMAMLDIDEDQANAILEMQLRRLAALERQKILDEYNEKMELTKDYRDILARPERQRSIISEELGAIVDKFGDDRRTTILPFSGDMNVEDLIKEEDVVVTITRAGFIKRTKTSEYRAQHRGGKGVKGASLRSDDVIEHFIAGSTHDWHLFFTNQGRVYRVKGYEIPEGSRNAKGQHIANLLAFQPEEIVVSIISLRNYEQAEYLILATRSGLVRKTRLTAFDSNKIGLKAITLRELEDGSIDQVVSAVLANDDDELFLVSRKGQCLRCSADEQYIRALSRSAGGVRGMRFKEDDYLLTMDVITDETADVFVVTEHGFAKRTPVSEYRSQTRGGLGIKVAQLSEARGNLVDARVTNGEDLLVIMSSGKVLRSSTNEISTTGRNTQGSRLVRLDAHDVISAVTLSDEMPEEEEKSEETGEVAAGKTGESEETSSIDTNEKDDSSDDVTNE
ncbi:MAG: DNA gyrase subunit A, partial [Actinomycetaceae bacterium]|nr:DNA gyrase subunit A [Actinomycetaceae bacterium]